MTHRLVRAVPFAGALMIAPALHAQTRPPEASETGSVSQPTPQPPVDVDNTVDPDLAANLTFQTVPAPVLKSGRLATSDSAEVLTRLPGVAVNSAGGFAGLPSIRGLSDQRLTILVDGVPVDPACPNMMMPPLSYTDPQTIHRLSALTGIMPVRLGGDSIGGAILAESEAPSFADGQAVFSGVARAAYRSNGRAFDGGMKLRYATKDLILDYAGSFTRSHNYRGGHNVGKVRSTEYKKTDQALGLTWRRDLHLVEVRGGVQFAPYEGFPNQYMDLTRNRSWFVNGRYTGSFSWGTVEATGDYRHVRHKMNFLKDKGGRANGGMPMNTHGHTGGGRIALALPVTGQDEVKLGVELRHQWLNDVWPAVPGSMMMGPDAYISLNHAHRNRVGGYAEWRRNWTDTLSTEVGGRFDHLWMNTGDVQPYGTGMMNMADAMAARAFNARDHHRRFTLGSANAILRWQATAPIAVELGYAHKARAPGLYELYAWGRGSMSSRMIGWFGDGNGYVGNLDLKSEQADTFSLAIALRPEGKGGWNARIAPYFTHVHNYIDVVKLTDFRHMMGSMMGQLTGFSQLQFANQTARFYGVDASVSGMLWNTRALGTGTLSADFSWVHGQNTKRNVPLYHQMPVHGRVRLDHRLGKLSSAIELELVAHKHRVDPVRNEPRTKGFAFVNMEVGYDLGPVSLSAGISNVFDRRAFLPLGGQSLGDLKATGKLRPVAARGRSFNFGVETRF